MRCERKKRCDEPVLPWCHAYESKPKLAALKIDLMRKEKRKKHEDRKSGILLYILPSKGDEFGGCWFIKYNLCSSLETLDR